MFSRMKKTVVSIMIVLLLIVHVNVYAQSDNDSIVSASQSASFVIKNDSSLWGWGKDFIGNGKGYENLQWTPIKILDNVRSVSVYEYQRAAVKKDNTLWVWGSMGGVYNGEYDPAYTVPTQVLSDVSMVSVNSSMVVLKTDGSVWVNNALLGDGTRDAAAGFRKVMENCKYIAAGRGNVYVIKEDNTLWGWGYNWDATLGNRTTEEVLMPIKILDDVKKIEAGSNTMMAIRLDNSLYSWGAAGNNGIYTQEGWVNQPGTPYKVMDNVLMAKGDENGYQFAVIKKDHTLWAWGDDNDFVYSNEPVKLYENVRDMAIGSRHIVVVFNDNTLGTAGDNYFKVLGHGDVESWGETIPLDIILSNIQDSPATWAAEEVEEAIGLQLIPDDVQNNYDLAITREEFCALAVRLIEKKTGMAVGDYITQQGLSIPAKSPFTDCDNPDVMAAAALSIVNGTSPTTFEPDNPLTREQAAKVLSATARALGESIEADYPTFSDESVIANWAKPYIGYVYQANVMKGVSDSLFDPRGSYQRQQAYMTILRLLKSMN